MSSVLTNLSAMSAVQSLAATQASLSQVQNEISTGLKVASASDNAAYYSIATNMRTNVSNLSAVSDSLNLGSSVVSTATGATSNVTSILQSISKALVSASQPGTDLDAVQSNIDALRVQLANTVTSASFNNVNLLDGSNAANPSVKFVAGVTGLGASTTVTTLSIDTNSTNLQGANYAGGNGLIDTAAAADATLQTATIANNTASANLTNATTAYNSAKDNVTNAITGATSAQLMNTSSSQFFALFGNGATLDASTGTVSNIQAGSLAANLVGTDGTMVIAKATTGSTVPAGTASSATTYSVGASASGTLGALYGAGATNSTTTGTAASIAGVAATAATAYSAASTNDATAKAAVNANAAASTIYNGALFSISQISLTSGSGTTPATSADTISAYISQVGAALTSVNNASEVLGAAASNISLQSTYTSSLSDNLTAGVGSLVDADMNEASTRLSALQTQQQLGVQALSVANQNSQLILKLFQ